MDVSKIRMCSDAVLTWDEQLKAAKAALEENAHGNAPDPVKLQDAIESPFIDNTAAAVALTSKKWGEGRKVAPVYFMDSPYGLKSDVLTIMNFWHNQARIRFVETNDPSESVCRITFNRGGSWSYIGTDNLVISDDRPTMQFGWLDRNSTYQEIRRVVLHETGHWFFLGHEQAHPEQDIPWDKPKVYEYYAATNGWSKEQVDSQVFFKYGKEMTNYTKYDPESIMHYAIDNALTIGDYEIGWNTERSERDKNFIARMYPKE